MHPLSKAEIKLILAAFALGAAAGFVYQACISISDARADARRLRWQLHDAHEKLDEISHVLAGDTATLHTFGDQPGD